MEKKSNKVKPSILSGFMELLPREQILFNRMLETIKRTYELFGFIPLDTPAIEKAEILLAKAGGETEKQIYRLKKGDADLALRFDLTVPLARYVAQYYPELAFPFKRYHIAKVYRGERPQKGRFREFYQCDIDIIGDCDLDLANDAEIPSVIYEVFRRLGFSNFTIRLNNRKILNGFFASLGIGEKAVDIMRAVDKLEKIGQREVEKELLGLEIPESTIKKLLSFISIRGGVKDSLASLKKLEIKNELFLQGVSELEKVVEMVSMFGVPKENFAIDLTIARGLDYYTGTVYETILNDYPGIGSVCSGGRYDNLAENYTDKKLPGVGISIGLTRLFPQLLEAGIIKPSSGTIVRVMVVPLTDKIEKAIEIASALREKGIPTAIYLEEVKPAKIFKYADRIGVPFIAIIGDDEIKENVVSLKNMETKEQKKLSLEEVYDMVA
ncbi:MAG: histidine--tRNA ligase [bacterium]